MRIRTQTLLDALTSPPGSSSYKMAIPLVGWETFQLLYDLRRPILNALRQYGQIYIFDGRYVTSLIKYGNYVGVDRVAVDAFFLTHLPLLRGGEEVGMVEPHLWILLRFGRAETYEVRRVADVKAVFAEIKRIVENDDAVKIAALYIEARIKDLDEELLKIALDNIERGAGYLRGLISDTIAAMLHYADKDVFHTFVKRLKEQWRPILETLGVKVEDIIAAEAKEAAKAGNQAVAEKLEVLDDLREELH